MKGGLKNNLPAAYISGRQEFYGLDFLVNEHTLIPRPDTIVLVEEAIKTISNFHFDKLSVPSEVEGQFPISKQFPNPNDKKILMVDVGTGTGCIPITIAKILKDIKDIKILATDISRGALKVAKKNAKKHNIKINFFRGDLLSPILKYLNIPISKYPVIVITANLPYLTSEWYDSEPSIRHEPRLALVGGGKNGLNLYEKLLSQIQSLISNIQYLNISVLLEIDPRQSGGIKKLVQKYLPDFTFEIKKDLAGRDRLAIIRY